MMVCLNGSNSFHRRGRRITGASSPYQLIRQFQVIRGLFTAAPLEASLAVDAAFIRKNPDSGIPLTGGEGLVFEAFYKRGDPESIQPRRPGELVRMPAALDDEGGVDQENRKSAAHPEPEIIILAGGQGFIEQAGRCQTAFSASSRPTG